MHAFFALLATLLLASSGGPAQGGEDEILAQLSKLRLDKNQIYSVRDITIRHDTLSISFNRGTIAFLDPVNGLVTGAIFVGSGEILSIPPDPIEKRQLFKFTRSPILNERFDAGIFRFTDDTYAEIIAQYQDRAQEDVTEDALSQLLPWEENLGERSRLLNLRLLADLIGNDDRPIFYAELRGTTLGWFDAVYDQRLAEEVAIVSSGIESDTGISDIWASFNKRSEARDPEEFDHEDPSPVNILAYDIDATILPDSTLEAVARLTLRSRRSGERVLGFDLTRTLRLSEVRLNGEPVPFFQHAEEGANSRFEGFDRVGVILPSPTEEAGEMTLEFDYSGSVLEARGEGIFYVSERALWYPNFGLQDPARFELAFHYPSENALVATGRLIEEREENGLRHSRWTSGREFFMAGFNYGDFTIESHETAGVPIFLCVNNDVETIFKEIESQRAINTEQALRAAAAIIPRRSGSPFPQVVNVSPDFSVFSTQGLADSVLDDVRATLEFFSDALGPYPFDRLAISQFPVAFSQGWPSLVYVSTLSFFTPEQRARLGLDVRNNLIATEFVRAHEIAHQWFGNKVGWRSYRDQWMIEGLSNYAGAMYLQHKYGEDGPLMEILDDAVSRLFVSTGEGTTHDDNGPVWLGHRLATSDIPDGYIETVYTKSTWIVHMLRMMMQAEDGSDDRFLAMLREFLDEFDGRPASTWDLKAALEKHMTGNMDVSGDGTMDWFFQQWVFGTGVPAYDLTYTIERSGGTSVVSGQITQTGVTDFVMPVPVYAGGEHLGDVVVSGEATSFSFQLNAEADEIELDPHQTVLMRNRN